MSSPTAFDRARAAAEAIQSQLIHVPAQAVVLGSGLSQAIEAFPIRLRLAYSAIPHFPRLSVAGQRGEMALAGENNPTLFLLGRCHVYEGRSLEEIALPVRALALAGIRTLLLTNAAGSLRPSLQPGRLCLIRDQLHLLPASPLRGEEAGAFGPLHLPGAGLYDPALAAALLQAARREKIPLAQGVYAAVPGPQYETPAEAQMLRRLGADLVGMSTADEALAARQMGMRVAALSLLTNFAGAAGDHEEVLRVGKEGAPRLGRLLRRFLTDLASPTAPRGRRTRRR